jgi:hypothetical protein
MTANEVELVKLVSQLKEMLMKSTVCLLENGTQFSEEARQLVYYCEEKIMELFQKSEEQ